MTFAAAAFLRDGYVRISEAFDAEGLRRRLAEFLAERDGIRLEDSSTWPVGRVGAFQSFAVPFTASAEVDAACDAVLGPAAWCKPSNWGAPLVTFPQPGAWQPPRSAWHLDFAPRFVDGALPGVRLLALLGPLRPRGGGTMLLAGSHRLVERLAAGQSGDAGHSADVRRMLRRAHPALSFLDRGAAMPPSMDVLSAGLDIEGVPVRFVETIGAAGDVVLMHPWLLHAATMNCSPLPRLMLSQSIFHRLSGG
jgi:hypothetical protein